MISILILGSYAEEYIRQVPQKYTGEVSYYYNKPLARISYDLLVVLDDLFYDLKITVGNTVFISGEPNTIRKYSSEYIKQFDIAFSTDNTLQHKRLYARQYLPWHIGLYCTPLKYNYDYFLNNKLLNKRCDKILLITSSKNITKGHSDRLVFVEKCIAYFGCNVVIYGRGYKEFDDKINILPNYKYQIVIENSSIKDYWTEKLADSFIAECYTFYYGCKNIGEYFPEKSYSIIDINQPNDAFQKIENEMQAKTYEKSIPYILISKKKILNNYNLMNMLPSLVDCKKKKRKKYIRCEDKVKSNWHILKHKIIVIRQLFMQWLKKGINE